jgi:tripartite-type tricarboxylate transporter receptor subunit TctC
LKNAVALFRKTIGWSLVAVTLLAIAKDEPTQSQTANTNQPRAVTDVPAPGQNYPTKPVRMIEPFGAGGGVDVTVRPVARKLSELWGQPVTVENHPGSGATAAPALVARSQPDGYTLLVNSSAQAYSAAFAGNLPYDPLKDFIPIAPLTSQPYVLVAGQSASINNVRELVAAAKSKPGQLKFGFAGIGTGSHLAVEKFNLAAGIKAVGVPPGPNDAIADVIAHVVAGDTTYMIAPISMSLPHVREGKLRALGVSGARRSPLLPEVPTIAEAGVAGFDFRIWYGIWAPAGVPAQVVDKLAKDIARSLAAPDLRDWLVSHGADPMNMTQAEFAGFVRRESESAKRLLRAAGVKSN